MPSTQTTAAKRSRGPAWSVRVVEMLALAGAAGAGLALAPPAAAIGLLFGLLLLAYGLDGRELLRPVRWITRRDTLGKGFRPVWVAIVVAACATVALRGARDGLGHGLVFIPAIVPFLLLLITVPAVLGTGGGRRGSAQRGPA